VPTRTHTLLPAQERKIDDDSAASVATEGDARDAVAAFVRDAKLTKAKLTDIILPEFEMADHDGRGYVSTPSFLNRMPLGGEVGSYSCRLRLGSPPLPSARSPACCCLFTSTIAIQLW
jgi:hypothetical protein